MLIAEGLESALKFDVKLSNLLGCIPLDWDSERQELKLKKDGGLLLYTTRLRLAYLCTVLSLLQVGWAWKEASPFAKMHSILFLSILVFNCSIHGECYSKVHMIISFFRGIQLFEGNRNKAAWHPNDFHGRVTKMLLKVLTASSSMAPVLYHLDLLLHPCMPINPGYFLIPECGGSKGDSPYYDIFAKLMVAIFSYANWSFTLGGFVFHMTSGLLLESHCLRNHILLCHKWIMSAKVLNHETVGHCQIHRENQVMGIEYRRIYSRRVVVLVLGNALAIHIIGLYSCLNPSLNLSSFMVPFYLISAFNSGFAILVIYGSLAEVYKASKRLHKDVKGKANFQKNAWFRRYMRSCQVIKVYMGNSNFIDECTPLNLEDFAIQQTVSLLLLK